MYVIAGLGNPGSKYEKTRHNVGFQVIDRLASKYHIDMNMKKQKANSLISIEILNQSYSKHLLNKRKQKKMQENILPL